jgi:hypothetical protein
VNKHSVLLTIKAVVQDLGGIKVVADALGISYTTLAHELNPHDKAQMSFERAIVIDNLHGQGRIAQAFAAAVGGVFMPLPRDAQDTDTGRCMVTVMKETAEAIQAAADNLKANRGENGLASIHKEGMEAIGAIVSMMVAAQRDAERSRPALHAVAA